MKRSTSKKDGQELKAGPGPLQAQSKLFSNVAAKSKAPLSFKRQPSSSRSAGAKLSQDGKKGHANSGGKNSMTVLKNFSHSTPEERLTPEQEKPEEWECADLSGDGEVVVIPDTPESKASKPWPKPAGRSFLCPVSKLTAMPGKKAPPPKVEQRRGAKKSLGPVSVEFGKKSVSEGQNAESKESAVMIVDDVAPESSAKFAVRSCPQGDSDEVGLDNHHNDLGGFDVESGCLRTGSGISKPQESHAERPLPAKPPVTPTKNSTDRNTAKRMAVQGLSPDPKRLFGVDAAAATVVESQGSKMTVSQCKVKAKRQLASLTGFRNVKEMNQTVNSYQLGGSTKPASRADTAATLAKDDILADILGEIANKPAPQRRKSTEKKTSAPSTQKPAVSGDSPEAESMETESACDASEDSVLNEILGELDSKLCQNNNNNNGGNISQRRPALGKPKSDVASHERSSRVESNTKPSTLSNSPGPPARPPSQKANGVDSGKQTSTPELQCPILRSKGTPVKTRREHLAVQSDDSMGGVSGKLASSFERLSPFKKRDCERGCSSSQTGSVQNPSSLKFTDKWNRYTVHSVSVDGDNDGNDDEDDHTIVISDHQGQIVVNPDLLLSGTTIVSGVYCLRRSILNEKFKGVDSKNVHMLYGSIIHSLFQEVLKERLTKTEEIMAAAQSIVQSNKFLHDMYGQSVSERKVMEEIETYITPLKSWIDKHVPCLNNGRANASRSAADVSVVQIHDIEETIWSPRIGVKGKIDMTVEVEMQSRGERQRKVVPLELKTGKASYSVEHKGQVTLYSMMMSDRRQNPGEGLLLYLKHNDMNTVPATPQNTRGLLQLRNEMAYYLSRQVKRGEGGEEGGVSHNLGPLPPPINSQRACSKCPQLLNCAFYQRSVENRSHSPDHAMASLVPEALSHLSQSHLDYLTHWLLCLELETAAQRTHGLRSIWCMSSADREAQGDCLQQLVMVNSVLGVPETQTFMEGQGCCVQFQRKPGFSGGPLTAAGLSKNDSVVVSSEDGRYIALSTGFVQNVTETIVDIVVDRDSFHQNATFRSLVFRVDRSDVFNTVGYLLTNLSRLMEPCSPHCQKLRSLIVDGRKPEFQLTMSKSSVEKVKRIFRQLNKPQKTAILKVLMSKDYVLIKGYPGTGKTSTIVALVKILRELGQSVLLTSYTHSAVDNILHKLKQDGVPFLRLGRVSRIHPQIVDHAADTLTPGISSVEELNHFYNSYDVVATSCLGVNHAVFSQRRFDVCIVDEASQVLQPACLGPLFHAHRFVLVGDPQQLPPVVQSKDASSLGMGESLFARLDGAGATYDLHVQYRMNSTIMQLSNELVYKGALTCGDDAVSKACIPPHTLSLGSEAEWLCRALDDSLTNAVVFLDTCQIAAPEKSDGKGVTNPTEAGLIRRLCTVFVQAGISTGDIGVIAPYRAQVRLLQKRLSECCPLQEVEVNTVDQYQGRDKAVVLISFVRSASCVQSDSSARGGLLRDGRRLNVAVTRAKHKLVILGDSSTLTHYPPLHALLCSLRQRQQIFPLPADLQLEDIADTQKT
ncbi:hypothetical protein ACOMHN_001414 [Nucella lapillus]